MDTALTKVVTERCMMQTHANESTIMISRIKRTLVLLVGAGLAWAVTLIGTGPARTPADTSYADLLVAAAAWTLLAGTGWLLVIALAALAEVLTEVLVEVAPAPGRARLAGLTRLTGLTRRLGCPARLRRWLLVSAGTAVALGLQASAGAATTPDRAGPAEPGPSSLGGLPVPGRPDAGAERPVRSTLTPLARSARSARPTRPDRQVLVQAGDSLWTLAARQLSGHASDAEIVELTRALHRVNHEVIGPDPDLIRPGQRLILPTHHSKEKP